MEVIMVCDTPPYGNAPTYEISLTYLERHKNYGPDKKILFKKELFDLEVKGQCPTYFICGCMTIRQCVAYRNDLLGTLTFDLKVK
jgi:hypothetical protein